MSQAPLLSKFGSQMSRLTGVRAIMKDIIDTLKAGGSQEFMNLSAGNPVIIPEVEQLWRDCTHELLNSSDYGEVVCRYGSSQGYEPLIEAIASDYNRRYGLALTSDNILITPGSQSLYFLAANAFGGYDKADRLKSIVLPLSPDYTGYGGVSLHPEALRAFKPSLELDAAQHRFKYRPDFDTLFIDEKAGCVIFSRPCNPTGNVLSDEETAKIAAIASAHNVPVLIDSAYAPPFPALNFTEMAPMFGGNVLHCMSLSKAGLPGERVGIAIGDAQLLAPIQAFLTNACIHASRYGQAIATHAIASGALAQIAETVIRPYYQAKIRLLEAALDQAMPQEVPWYLHRGEGAIFAWLWFDKLPITDWELYQRLKAVGVIVVPGSPFFPGLREDWPHKQQCLRISLTASDAEIETAMQRLAQVIDQVYAAVAVG